MTPFQIRRAHEGDGPGFVALVRALADFEKLPGPTDDAARRLLADAFGERPHYELLVAEQAGRIVAYAAFFHTYSTFLARPGLYLEDLFVHPDARGAGIATALMRELAAIATQRGCGRFEWSVLDWNGAAQRFYERLGARHIAAWQIYRLEGDEIAAVAGARLRGC